MCGCVPCTLVCTGYLRSVVWKIYFITLTECKTGTTQKLSFEVYTTIDLKNTSITSHSNGTLLFSQNTPHQMPLLLDAVIFLSSIAVSTANGQFSDCATTVFSERCRGVLVVTC